MSHEIISYMLKSEDVKKRLQFQLVFQCGPFLKGLKPACIMNLKTVLYLELAQVLDGTRIEYVLLNQKADNSLVFFYREELFGSYLSRKRVQKFLRRYGYYELNPAAVLTKLTQRIKQFSAAGEEFPHEMGAILGYPLDDVAGFIEHRGKDYLYCGYWKVYHNLQQAKLIFRMYDYARTSAVNEFVAGKNIRTIACA